MPPSTSEQLLKATEPAAARGDLDAARAFFLISRGWWTGSTSRTAWFWTLALALMILINVGVNVGVNAWHGWFFNALEKKDAGTAGMAIAAFPLIVIVAAGVGVLILKTRETLQVHWRRWLSGRLMDMWVTRRRFQRLAPAGLEPANPEYRIADDTRWATEPLVDFAIGLLSAIITVITFVGILWSIGGGLRVGSGDSAFVIPAYLVLAAILYGVAVSTLMILVGRRLPARYAARNETEARFRFGLMRLRDSADAIALGGGQFSERRALGDTYETLAQRWLAVIRERVKLTWITNGSGVLVPVVPLLLAAPKYLSGEMSLGAVMQVAAAFVQVQIAFNWIAENFMRIAEWLASARRVNDLADAIDRLESIPEENPLGPRLIPGAAGLIAAHELCLRDRDGRPLTRPMSFEARAGETVHLGDLSGEAQSALVRALAGQWPWGEGAIVRDSAARVGGAARRMRFAETSLRHVLEDGAGPDAGSHLADSLRRTGLDHLVTRLDEVADWDRALTETERQRLAVARLHAARPDLVLIDDALDALDEASAAALFADLRAALPGAIFVTAGSSAVLAAAARSVESRMPEPAVARATAM